MISARDPGYNANIQYLRAFAVLLVLGFHLQLPGMGWGYLGVDLFFLVSGFLMPLILPKYSPLGFLLARVRRIYPALLAAIAACFVLGWWLMMPLEMDGLSWSALTAIFSVSEFWFAANTGYFDQHQQSQALLHTWSLGVEFLCYALVAGLLLVARDGQRRERLAAALALLTAAAFLGWWWVQGEETSYFNPLPRIALFFIAFWISSRGLALSPRLGLGLTLLGAVLLVVLSGPSLVAQAYPGPAVFLLPLVGLPVMMLRSPLPLPRPLGAAMSWLGDISYSLYIWHWPIIVFQTLALRNYQIKWWEAAALAVLSLLAASVSFYLIERRAFWRRGPVMLGMALVLGAVAITGMVTQGFAFRFPAMLAPYATQHGMQDRAPYACPIEVQGLEMTTSCSPLASPERTVIFVGDSHSRHFMHMFTGAEPDTRLIRFSGQMDRITRSLPALQRAARELGAERVYISYYLHHEDEGDVAELLRVMEELQFSEAVILRDIPSYVFDPVVCWVRQNSDLMYRSCQFDLRERVPYGDVVNARSRPWQLVLESGLPAWDTHEQFCNADGCTLLHDGELLYRDNNHLNENVTPAAKLWLYEQIFAADRRHEPEG